MLKQTYNSIEIIVIDDGSTDDTAERIKIYGDRIIYYPKKNQGIAAAWNSGLNLCKGEFIQFLDADDSISEDKIETQVAFLIKNPDTDIAYSDYLFVNASGTPLQELTTSYKGTVFENGEEALNKLVRRNYLTVHCTLVRRKVIDSGLRFDDVEKRLNEDWDFWLRAAAAGFKFKYVPGPLALYFKHGKSLTDEELVNHNRCLYLYEKISRNRSLLPGEAFRIFISFQCKVLGNNYYNFGQWKSSRSKLWKALSTSWKEGGGLKSFLLIVKTFIKQLK